MIDILKRIAQLRDARGWNNNQMANEAGIGAATVINWFHRDATPRLNALEALCNAFGITIVEFFNDGNKPIALSASQSDMIAEYDRLDKDQKRDLVQLLRSLNTKK